MIGKILGALAAVLLAASASATTLAVGDSRDLGYIQFGLPSGDAARTAYVNYLIDMAPGAGPVADPVTGQTYTRTLNSCGACTDAVFGANGGATGNVNLGTGYLYLFAKYDGPNYGVHVWNVSGLTGIITIPLNPPGGGNGLSGYTVFNGRGGGDQVPEPGTLALLGLGLAGLGLMRRRISA